MKPNFNQRHPSLPLILIALFLFVSLCAAGAQDAGDLYQKVSPSVVFLRHEVYLDPSFVLHGDLWERMEAYHERPFLGEYLPISTGSGFGLDGGQLLLTNRHVALVNDDIRDDLRRDAALILNEAIWELPGNLFRTAEKNRLRSDVERLTAEVEHRLSAYSQSDFVGATESLHVDENGDDLALLRLIEGEVPRLELLEMESVKTVEVGDQVHSFGYPLGQTMDEYFAERVVTMNSGTISAFRQTQELGIQHSAAISGGNSGGPLVDDNGVVIGVNTASLQESRGNDLFYAINIQRVHAFLEDAGVVDRISWVRSEDPAEQSLAGLDTDEDGALLSARHLIIETFDDVDISLNGEYIGQGFQVIDLSSRENELILSYDDEHKSYQVRWNTDINGPSILRFDPDTVPSTVTVRTEPSEAQVVIDGRNVGVSPLNVELPRGEYVFGIRLQDHHFSAENVIVDSWSLELSFTGEPTHLLELTGETADEGFDRAVFDGRGESEDFWFTPGEDIRLPDGVYDLRFLGKKSHPTARIPVAVDGNSVVVDLDAYWEDGLLRIDGYDPETRVWIDGIERQGDLSDGLLLPIGIHTVAIWKDLHQPVMPLEVMVAADGNASIPWPGRRDSTTLRQASLWTGIGLGVAGGTLMGLGFYLGQNSVAMDGSTDYQDYLQRRQTADNLVYAGIGSISGAALSTIIHLLLNSADKRTRREFGLLD